MTKIAYLDCFSGVSGDMFLGALLDAGLPFGELKKGLESLPLDGYSLEDAILRGQIVARHTCTLKASTSGLITPAGLERHFERQRGWR